MSPTPKKIRSSSPDVIVAVGQGDDAQEFECYRIALSFASPYFDSMLSTNMSESNSGRIEFPNKNPEEWKLFYQCIDPSRMAKASHSAITTVADAKILVPWFHEFQMAEYLGECDKILSTEIAQRALKKVDSKPGFYGYDIKFWDKDTDDNEDRLTKRKAVFKTIIELLQFACVYGLERTKDEADRFVRFYLAPRAICITSDLYDLSAIKALVELILPLEREERGDGEILVSNGKLSFLWNSIKELEFELYLRKSGLSDDDINNNSMLPLLVETFIQRYAAERDARESKKAARRIINFMHSLPSSMYYSIPSSNNGQAARDRLTDILRKQFESLKFSFKQLGVSRLPDSYTAP